MAKTRDHKNGSGIAKPGGRLPKTVEQQVCVDLFGSNYTVVSFLMRSSKHLFFFVFAGQENTEWRILRSSKTQSGPESTCGRSGVKIFSLPVICLSCTSVSRSGVKTSGGAEYMVTDTEYTGVVEVQVEENRGGEYS